MDNVAGAVSVVVATNDSKFNWVATIYKMRDNIETGMGEGEKKKKEFLNGRFIFFSKKQF